MKNTGCPHKKAGCGGCPLLSVPYEEQLQQKQTSVERLLGKFAKVEPIVGMENPWHYRNKAISTFCGGGKKPLQSGIYAQGSHRVIPIQSCLLQHPALDKAIEAVRTAAQRCRYPVFDEDRRTGLLRHVLVRHSLLTDEVLVCLVTSGPALPGSRNFVQILRQLCPNVSTVVQNINSRHSSAVLGNSEKVLYGKGYIVDELCGVRFRIGASSFYQINPSQTEKLYQLAVQAAGAKKGQRVIDAYCGVGTIGLVCASQGAQVIGMEQNATAVRCAVQNARANGLSEARFVAADATSAIQRMALEGETADVVILDPPRAGSTPAFLDAVCQLSPARVVYVSCNPETQKRDLKYLCSKGWKVDFIQPVDLFPHTEHVETVVAVSKA
ncbi:MAG: 23S rRNA (uracil(1939)-C(5))-methyltransferase RlmD [Candidatus Fournierella pullistercoris]|uniref:23S rRNA (Uracil(1939)-C(5))-methyltransferase RlmD n=1 Tax=Candidatus Allofournierella pullistercoris TaxID=2838597 RepID=A0A948T2M6_9FIRM|nr:23S rRNA (uracil(1939)-C(5))-methyltransferase RlmD [Candidatus Fournierella pullistercoris]